ncbi:MAG: AI-2E family transporter [Clostridia bacterium]|nr:AI-2E family transporter [Clostridia bacterium]
MEKKTRSITKWLYWFLFAVAVIAVYKTLDNFSDITSWIGRLLDVLAPFLAGILIAYILYLPSRKIENLLKKTKKIKFISKKARTISVLAVYVIVLVIIILAIKLIVPPIAQSITDLANNFQNYYEIAMQKIEELPADSFLKSEQVTSIINEFKDINLKEILNMDRLTQYAKGAINIANSIFDIFVAIIVSVYILIERGQIIEFFKKLTAAIFQKETYENIGKYFDRTNNIFFNFLASQVLDGIVVGTLTSIAMSILGVKYAVLLGFMIGLLNLIPYFGAIVAVIIAAIITLLTGGLAQAIWMLVIVTILQQIDANIINPKIVGNSLKISPILVIFSVTIGGAYFGVIGMFLAVPVMAVIKLIVSEFIEYRNKQKLSQ